LILQKRTSDDCKTGHSLAISGIIFAVFTVFDAFDHMSGCYVKHYPLISAARDGLIGVCIFASKGLFDDFAVFDPGRVCSPQVGRIDSAVLYPYPVGSVFDSKDGFDGSGARFRSGTSLSQ
jgi:hypothetical protein